MNLHSVQNGMMALGLWQVSKGLVCRIGLRLKLGISYSIIYSSSPQKTLCTLSTMNKSYRLSRTRVKICGFTQPDDAVNAARLGVDAVGLVFFPPSPRNIDIDRARQIVSRLPAFVSVVALFVDAEPERIRGVLEHVNVDLIQFHGREPPGFCRSFGIPYIKAVRMRDEIDVGQIEKQYSDARGLLLDAYHPREKGGTGRSFDWQRIPSHCGLPIILAGGLSADNVREAINLVHPYAIDVSSGVETAKGIKDAEKMLGLMKEVNEVECAKQ